MCTDSISTTEYSFYSVLKKLLRKPVTVYYHFRQGSRLQPFLESVLFNFITKFYICDLQILYVNRRAEFVQTAAGSPVSHSGNKNKAAGRLRFNFPLTANYWLLTANCCCYQTFCWPEASSSQQLHQQLWPQTSRVLQNKSTNGSALINFIKQYCQ